MSTGWSPARIARLAVAALALAWIGLLAWRGVEGSGRAGLALPALLLLVALLWALSERAGRRARAGAGRPGARHR